MPQLVCVRSYGTRFKAEYAASLLESHEIAATVMVDDSGGAEPMPFQTVGSARVLVERGRLAEAQRILEELAGPAR